MTRNIQVGKMTFAVEPGAQSTFWDKVQSGGWEPETYRIFDEFIKPDDLVIDIGAWVGSTCLYAAQKAERTIAFEPDPISFAALSLNLEANADAIWRDRLRIENKAVNADGAPLVLGSRDAGGDSMSSALFCDAQTNWTVEGVAIAKVLEQNARAKQPVFIKIDIEGGEYTLLPAMRGILANPRVTALVSMHPVFLRQTMEGMHGDDWRTPFRAAHYEVMAALPRGRRVFFGQKRSTSRLAARLRCALTGTFTRQILVA